LISTAVAYYITLKFLEWPKYKTGKPLLFTVYWTKTKNS